MSQEGQSLPRKYGQSDRTNTDLSSLGDSIDVLSLDKSRSSITFQSSVLPRLCQPGICGRFWNRKFAKWSLRTQLLVTFGLVTVFSVTFVMVAAILTTFQSGETVVNVGVQNMNQWFDNSVASTTRLMSDIATKKYEALDGLTLLLRTVTQERFLGSVPFRNYLDANRGHVYPLKARHLLPFVDQLEGNVVATDSASAREHVRHRFPWYFDGNELGIANVSAISTTDAVFIVPDAPESCEPFPAEAETLLRHAGCYKNGTVSSSLAAIHEKVSDFASPLLKALYEYHGEVKSIGIHFVDDGVGASVVFPGRSVDGKGTYTSIGCDWMSQSNPLRPDRPIGTPEQIAHCHKAGNVVGNDQFRVLEQDWCRVQAMEPDRMHIFGPDYDDDGFWHLSAGRAIYDKDTNELLACTRVLVSVAEFLHADNVVLEGYEAEFGVLRWDGTLLNATSWEPDPVHRTKTTLIELEVGVDQAHLDDMKQLFLDDFDARGSIQDISFETESYYASLHPFPLPAKGETKFQPEFLVFFGTSYVEREIREAEVQELVDREVRRLVEIIVGAGFASMVVVGLAVCVAAFYLTSPLQWMVRIGTQILESAGSPHVEGASSGLQIEDKPWTSRYAPPSEITRLVDGFHTMIEHFSGQGIAKLIKQDLFELKNPFKLEDKFRTICDSRFARYSGARMVRGTDTGNYDSSFDRSLHLAEIRKHSSIDSINFVEQAPSETRVHWGPNVHVSVDDETFQSPVQSSVDNSATRGYLLRSPIFWWILSLSALPLIVCMIAISAYVLYDIYNTLPSLAWALERSYTDLQRLFILPFALTRASYASNNLVLPLRDLYVFNRIASWLYNGAIPLADSFTEMTTSAETCKMYPPGSFCPAAQSVCDCAWDDPFGVACSNDYTDSRSLQELYFEGLRDGVSPNGDRDYSSVVGSANVTSRNGTSPSTTFFWDSIDSLPGSDQGYNASGTETTFGRLRTMSAMSPILIPLYNYVEGTPLARTWGSAITFEADGMTSGYAGCSMEHVHFAHHQTADDNGHCPLGKYGCVYKPSHSFLPAFSNFLSP